MQPSGPLTRQLPPTLRYALLAAGFLFVALGVLGIFLPILPTVPLLLLALACFARSSERFYCWLLNHAHLGPLVKPYLDGRGMTRTSKLKALILLWISITASVVFLIDLSWVRGLLLIIALGVTCYLLRLPNLVTEDQSDIS